MYAWRRINVCSFHYHGLENLQGNQRSVTMAACVKSIRGIYPDTTDFVTLSISLSSDPCQIGLLNLKRVRHRAFKQLDASTKWRYSVRRLRYDRHTELVRFGAFVINNLHPKPKTNIGIATRKVVVRREVSHVSVLEPSHWLVVARL